MAQFLKQSTAFTFRIGPFLDSTDGVTAETALTIAQADIQISKAGGAFAQTSATPTTTHDADGWYQCPLTTTDTGTVGTLTVQVVMAGACPVWKDFMVLPANVYDSLVGGSDLLDVNTAQWLGTACATPTVAGVPEVDTTHFGGTVAATPATAGIPTVRFAAAGVADILTTALTEAYRADGATGTLTELLYEIIAHLGESSIVTTTKTIKKIDGSTTAATFTLNDATTPTSITRAT